MTTTVVKETLKEALLGTEDEPQLSQQTRMDFLKHAVKDEESDEYFMTEDRFIDAIAPEKEDYVRLP
jgi:solute carrier family 25 aspartate/glutamate transporter 12/13